MNRRFANRIKNGTFEIDNQEYHVPTNEHDGLNTLHGGSTGYDARNWTVVQANTSSITFSLFDPSGFQGFPGSVVSHPHTTSRPHVLMTR
jgi:aldose 1-epimerase